ncbi:hypothetical protein [Congregibacter sp.]|uniref:hypothetical protein n=1 Tax=Congregibacter sp. TaxID=2744308 RepID=UPI003F6C3895
MGVIATSAIALAGISANVAAQQEDGENRSQGKRRGPPPEALEACANLSEGEVCGFTGRHGDMTGVCFAPPKEDAALACAPEGGPPKHRERGEEMEQIED